MTLNYTNGGGTLGRGSLCLKNGSYVYQRCNEGLRCDTEGTYAVVICG
ncbi:hypothetical protein [Aquimarina litoralis]